MMQRRSHRLRLAALTSAAVIGLGLVGSTPALAGGTHGGGDPRIVARGLDNPRQLSFTKSGDLLVAESGEGGTTNCMPGPEGQEVCFGTTGSVTKISSGGKQTRIIHGLPSLAGKDTGLQAIGPADVSSDGGKVSVLIGLGANPAVRDTLPAAGQRMGTLIQTTRNHHTFRTIADLAAWEAANDPVNRPDPDSNPVGMLAERGRYIVADAGGNTLLGVGNRGRIRLLATFPNGVADAPPFPPIPDVPPGTQIPMQAVPTSVAAKGHDGAYYVSQLTGFPFPKGGANIYRIDPRSGRTTVYASGLTNVTDLAFRGRSLYAVQVATDGLLSAPPGSVPIGSVVKVKPGASAPADHTVVQGGLAAPYGIAIRGDQAYVTTHSTEKDAGEVIRFRL